MNPNTTGVTRQLWGVALLCAVVACIQYAVTLGHGFVLDDVSSVLGSVHTTGGLQLPLLEATVNGQGTFFRPFGYLGFSLDHTLWGTNPFGFHATCVLLHALATAAFVLLAGYLVNIGTAFVSGLLFAVHPVHVEAVANVWNRTGVQASLFVFVALIVWLRIKRPWTRILLLNIFAFVAVGSKEGAIVLPVALVSIMWLRHGGRFDIKPALACLPAYALWFVLRKNAIGDHQAFGELFTDEALSVRLFTMGELFAHNAQLLILPLMLRADYTAPTTTMLTDVSVWSIVGWVAFIGVAVALVIAIQRRHWTALGLGFLVATIWPFLHIAIPLGVPVAERWLYLPSAGVCLLIGEGVWRSRSVLTVGVQRALILTVFLSFTVLTTIRTLDWERPLTLWEADAAKPNASAFTWGNYSLSLWGEGRHSDALKAMMHARNLKPDWTVYDVKYREMRSMLRIEPPVPGE